MSSSDDEIFNFYYTVMDTHSELINETKESVVEQVLGVYIKLTAKVDRRELPK